MHGARLLFYFPFYELKLSFFGTSFQRGRGSQARSDGVLHGIEIAGSHKGLMFYGCKPFFLQGICVYSKSDRVVAFRIYLK